MSTLAINWQPELRGILTVIIAVGVLMGSVYLILGTNMGARLGFLVAFSALAGWMFIMSAIWWSYGIGLKGPDVAWKPMNGKAVIENISALNQAGVVGNQITVDTNASQTAQANSVDEQLVSQGWKKLAESAAAYGQAGASASGFIVESGAFGKATDFKVVNVFDKGGEAFPKFGKIDQIAFWHHPYRVLVEVAPLIPPYTEPGRAPAAAQIDPNGPHRYIYMFKDLGAKREPAAVICIGSFIVFLTTCWLLHRRDKVVAAHRGGAVPAKA